jgi:hypothetical protein
MKTFIKLTTLVFITLLLNGCAEKNEELPYEIFRSDFFEFTSNFEPEGFLDISGDGYTSVTASFPENKLNNKKVDAVNDDINYPYRYETYYMSEDNTTLVKVNFIYFPQSKESGFITLYTMGQKLNTNFKEEYKDIKRPEITEYLISFDGYIVLLHFIGVELENNSNISNEDYSAGPSIRSSFYTQFEDALLKIIENR